MAYIAHQAFLLWCYSTGEASPLITISTLKRRRLGNCTLSVGSADALSVEFAGTPAELRVGSVARDGAEVVTSTVPVPPCVSMAGAAFTVAGPDGGETPPSRSDDTVGGKLTGLGGGGPAGSEVVLGAPVKMLRPAGGAFAPEISTCTPPLEWMVDKRSKQISEYIIN